MFAEDAWNPVEQLTVAVDPYVVFPEFSWIVPFNIGKGCPHSTKKVKLPK